jgi:hypothetical protein
MRTNQLVKAETAKKYFQKLAKECSRFSLISNHQPNFLMILHFMTNKKSSDSKSWKSNKSLLTGSKGLNSIKR